MIHYSFPFFFAYWVLLRIRGRGILTRCGPRLEIELRESEMSLCIIKWNWTNGGRLCYYYGKWIIPHKLEVNKGMEVS